MLTKEQIVTKFAGVTETLVYVVMFSIPSKKEGAIRPHYVHRDIMPVRFSWEQGKKRLKLVNIAEVWPCKSNDYGNVGERNIAENGYIVSKQCFGYAIFDPEGQGQTLQRFMRHLIKQKWQTIE